ncbi:hypothetical protein MTBBW1_760052 [Desulfamplus magnetovallimortis]|uniref:Uncharacterized protein n=1 Tax=Desulfamplus magnetovallimortis TaxID=1246637 RepID=A0A1W1HJP7_9BACT|nr:hypothetical protein MTBBW1_760052 [Desulfamplus magnetovallimortis]
MNDFLKGNVILDTFLKTYMAAHSHNRRDKSLYMSACYGDFLINPHDCEGITTMHESHDISVCYGDFYINVQHTLKLKSTGEKSKCIT